MFASVNSTSWRELLCRVLNCKGRLFFTRVCLLVFTTVSFCKEMIASTSSIDWRKSMKNHTHYSVQHMVMPRNTRVATNQRHAALKETFHKPWDFWIFNVGLSLSLLHTSIVMHYMYRDIHGQGCLIILENLIKWSQIPQMNALEAYHLNHYCVLTCLHKKHCWPSLPVFSLGYTAWCEYGEDNIVLCSLILC